MKHIVYKSFFGLGPAPGVAPTSPGSLTKVGGNKSKVQNIYYELTPFESQPTPPYNDINKIYLNNPDWMASPWLSEGDQTSLADTCYVVNNETYGHIQMKTISAGTQGFFYIGDGIYMPTQDDAGNVTNTDDWSTKYDACRGYAWVRYMDAGASAGVLFGVGERPTAGTSNFGGLSVEVFRSFSHSPRIGYADGNGNSGAAYMTTVENVASDTIGIQWELVRGSHCKLEMFQIQNGVINFANSNDPTDWLFTGGNYIATADLSGAGYDQIGPVNPSILAQLSSAGQPGYLGKWCWEARPIGGKWKYLK